VCRWVEGCGDACMTAVGVVVAAAVVAVAVVAAAVGAYGHEGQAC
jgi:hypothetical protein